MASWRQGASPEAQADMDRLLNAALPFAQQMLAKRGAFLPYGVALTSDGEEKMLAADPALGEHPGAPAVLELLREGVVQDRQALRGYAIVLDALVDGADAIRVDIEHRDGIALMVLLPYAMKGRLVKKPEYGQLRASSGEHRVWSTAG